MKKIVSVLILAAVLCSFAFASSVYSVFPNVDRQYIDLLVEGTNLNNTTLEGGTIYQLAPQGTLAYQRAKEAEQEENSFSIITTSFIAYPENWKKMSFEEKRLCLFNILTSISTQEGITYISRTAGGKPKTLFSESFVVTDPKNKKSRTEDPVFTEVPSSYVLYSYQNDSRFGGNFYEVDYTSEGSEVFMKINNLSAMKFMGVTCVKEKGLSLYMDVLLCDEGIVVCSMATVYDQKPTIGLLFYTVDLQSSFQRRLDALKVWFFTAVENT
ncbi:MAG: hypothetical protein K5634_00730 [Sphaerochaetaceae bacterium]|nr:hypothetical protein [Sphaerochaetaceae bacterium]